MAENETPEFTGADSEEYNGSGEYKPTEEQGTEVVLDLHVYGSQNGGIHTVAFMPDTLKILLDFDLADGQQRLTVVASAPADTVAERYELIVVALQEAIEMLANPAVLDSLPSDEPSTEQEDES